MAQQRRVRLCRDFDKSNGRRFRLSEQVDCCCRDKFRKDSPKAFSRVEIVLSATPNALGRLGVVAEVFRIKCRIYIVAITDRRGLAAIAYDICNRFLHYLNLAAQSLRNKKSLSTSDYYLLTLTNTKDDIGD